MHEKDENKRLPLHDQHIESGAKMVPFAGFEMPIQYSGIVEEHNAVRNGVGVFDVSHMGEFYISGSGALDFLQSVTLNDVSKLEAGQAQYSGMCYDNGGMVDDLLVYRLEDRYMVVVNASNITKDFDWMRIYLPDDVLLENVSDDVVLIAVQGPYSTNVVRELTPVDVESITYYHFVDGEISGRRALISKTGYTGERGYELYVDAADAAALWNDIFDAGEKYGIMPAGLGARDTLRLEMGYCLYGNDIDDNTNPLEAGLGWITKFTKGDFTGSEALKKVKEEGVTRKLVGIEMKHKAIPRKDYDLNLGGVHVGQVTSGTFSPSLRTGIGMGYISIEHSKPGTELTVDIRGRQEEAFIVKPPFYQVGKN